MSEESELEDETVSLAKVIRRFDSDLEPAAAKILPFAESLARFLGALRIENRTTNLVSARAAEPEELVRRHLFDSLRGLAYLPPPRTSGRLRLLDLGTGGGFPALPILIVRPDIEGVLVESTGKKCVFLEGVVRSLGLTARVVNARFPDSFQMKNVKPFEILTTRAVRSAGRLVRAAGPLLVPGGRALLWTTELLGREALKESGLHRGDFHRTDDSGTRVVAVLECST